MVIYSIYKSTNSINGKVYIGWTSRDFQERRKEHLRESNNTNAGSYNYKFHAAIRKYNESNFQWELIYQTKDQTHSKLMETHFINTYNSTNNGYNMTLGGDGTNGYFLTEEHRKKISIVAKKRKFSEETRKKLSLSKKQLWQNSEFKKKMSDSKKGEKNHMYGKTHSPETRQKLKELELNRLKLKA